jgi:hypothetical protein
MNLAGHALAEIRVCNKIAANPVYQGTSPTKRVKLN